MQYITVFFALVIDMIRAIQKYVSSIGAFNDSEKKYPEFTQIKHTYSLPADYRSVVFKLFYCGSFRMYV